ncbi:trimeric intracellular cation channel type B [Chanos chanos]|uniref:Trimeric intracellular cation channel type B n=1 Tax=Chanos chanos TaxID=29144 RepID=A0A6J2UUY5_CHACN|nr:trimeric intracellular cation channel type B [Chanos chanos]
MDLFTYLNLNELALGLSNLQMFPFFDSAHYIVSVMALREQPGALEVSRRSPLACWFSSMLYCFGGAVLSSMMMAEPPIAPLSNSTNVLLASFIWYLVFYCPQDLIYSSATILPLRLVLSGMKEVTRTWKVLGGVTQAQKKYKDGLLVMIAIGWAKGAGGGLISNFEQLVRGVWKPETNELLKMSYPTKVTLIGAVLFALQQSQYLPLQTHQLMLLYTVFIVLNKTRMMLLGSSSSPFAPVEAALYHALFARPAGYCLAPKHAETTSVKHQSALSRPISHSRGKDSLNGAAVAESDSPDHSIDPKEGSSSATNGKDQIKQKDQECSKKCD